MGCSNPHPHCQVNVLWALVTFLTESKPALWEGTKGWDKENMLVMWRLEGKGSACSSLDRCGPAVSCQILPSVRSGLSGPIKVSMESPC